MFANSHRNPYRKSSQKIQERKSIFIVFLSVLCKILEKGTIKQIPGRNPPSFSSPVFFQESIPSRIIFLRFCVFCSGEPLGSLWGLVCKSGEALEGFGEPRIGISSRISIPSELKSEILEEILILRWLWGPLGSQDGARMLQHAAKMDQDGP